GGSHLHRALQRIQVDATVARPDIDRSGQVPRLDSAIAGVNRDVAVDGGDVDGAIAGLDLQVAVSRHMNFDTQPPVVVPAQPALLTHQSRELHSIAVLLRFYVRPGVAVVSRVRLVILHGELHAASVRRGDVYTTVVSVHVDV